MKKIANYFATEWYQLVLTLAAVSFVCFLLWFQLESLLPGFSRVELSHSESAGSLIEIARNPLYLPQKLLLWMLSLTGVASPARAASTLLGLVVVFSFYYILRNWYTRRVALQASFLFVTSFWFLVTARSGMPFISYSLLIVPIALLVWLQKKPRSTIAIAVGGIFGVLLLYIPGFIWFVLPVFLWQAKRLFKIARNQPPPVIAGVAVVGTGLISPLVIALLADPSLIRPYLGIAENTPAITEYLKNIVEVPARLFIYDFEASFMSVGSIAIVSWFGGAMFLVGSYAYWFKRNLERTRFITAVLVIGTLLVAADGPVNAAILLPFVYLIIAGGIALLLQQWFTVFPKNPIAKTMGPLLMTLAVIMASFFNVYRYFIAWPNTPATKQFFSNSIEA